MRRSKEELLDYIFEIDDPNLLYSLKYKMETTPFCGIEQCYDLERFIFHIITIEERQKVIEHIKKISTDVEKKIHIFTTNTYYSDLPEQIKCFLKINSNYITILNKESEINEIGIRSINQPDLSYISDIELPLEQKGVIPNIDNIRDLEGDIVSQSLADLYFRTIINYTSIFPEFIPLFIDYATNANLILAYKLNDIRDRIQVVGCLLNNSQNTILLPFENKQIGLYSFKTHSEFMKIFVNDILD